jgi:hypothetical protein
MAASLRNGWMGSYESNSEVLSFSFSHYLCAFELIGQGEELPIYVLNYDPQTWF